MCRLTSSVLTGAQRFRAGYSHKSGHFGFRKGLALVSLERNSSTNFIASLRETVFSFLLLGFQTGLGACLQRPVRTELEQKIGRMSQALKLAVKATSRWRHRLRQCNNRNRI